MLGRESEADVRVGQLRAQALPRGEHDRLVVERHRGQAVHGVPGRVRGKRGVEVAGHEAEVGGRELPLAWMTIRTAAGLELLEPGDLAHVDLGGEVAEDGLLERLAGLQVTAWERPRFGKGLACTLPKERLEAAPADPQDDRERDVGGALARPTTGFCL